MGVVQQPHEVWGPPDPPISQTGDRRQRNRKDPKGGKVESGRRDEQQAELRLVSQANSSHALSSAAGAPARAPPEPPAVAARCRLLGSQQSLQLCLEQTGCIRGLRLIVYHAINCTDQGLPDLVEVVSHIVNLVRGERILPGP